MYFELNGKKTVGVVVSINMADDLMIMTEDQKIVMKNQNEVELTTDYELKKTVQ